MGHPDIKVTGEVDHHEHVVIQGRKHESGDPNDSGLIARLQTVLRRDAGLQALSPRLLDRTCAPVEFPSYSDRKLSSSGSRIPQSSQEEQEGVELKTWDSEISTVVARLEVVFRDVGRYRRLLGYRGPEAQRLLDSFQSLLDTPELDPGFRRRLIVATQRLSNKSQLYPKCYELKNVVQEDQYPRTAGGFADIYKGIFQGRAVCMKVIRLYQDSEIERFLRQISKEALLWGQLSHPNVLRIYGLYRFQNRVCLVSPWMKEGIITEYLKRRPQVARLPLAVDVARGLLYLHENRVIHGDLKGSNILVDDTGNACIADFGISSISDSEVPAWTSLSSAASKGGSVQWQAPELFDTENDDMVKNTVASDVYAWGCVCYEIFTGDIPFAGVQRDATVTIQIMKGARPTRPPDSTPPWSDWALTESIWSLMQDCWRADPAERPSVKYVIGQLAPVVTHLGASSTGGGFLSPAGFREKMSAPFIDMAILHELDDLLHESVDPEPGVNATAGDTLDFRDDSTSSRSITAFISRASRRGTSNFNHVSVGQDVRGPPTVLLHPMSVAWRTPKPSIPVFNGHSHAQPPYA